MDNQTAQLSNTNIEPQNKAQILNPPHQPIIKTNSKWRSIIVILIFMLALPVGGYFFLNKLGILTKPSTVTITTPINIAWKDYSAQFYELKYPSTWILDSTQPDNFSLTSPDSKITSEGTLEKLGSQLIISESITNDATISAQTDDPRLSYGRTNLIYTSVDGIKALSFDQNADYYNSYTEFIKDGLEYSIQLESGSKITHERDLPIYNKVLKTFKFRDINPLDTSSWKTYKNTKIGFTIKYPERYSPPTLPSGIGDSPTIYATGTEDNADIIFGKDYGDSFDLEIFPYTGDLNNLPDAQDPYEFSDRKDVYLVPQSLFFDNQNRPTITVQNLNRSITEIFFMNKNYGFRLKANPAIILTILSTFKFIQ